MGRLPSEVFCPRCKSKPGNPCTKDVMGARMWVSEHVDRIDVARQADRLDQYRRPSKKGTQ